MRVKDGETLFAFATSLCFFSPRGTEVCVTELLQVERRICDSFEVHCQQPVTVDSWLEGVLGGYVQCTSRVLREE